MTSKPLILASTSPWRADLLSRLQIPFTQVDPDVDEQPFKEKGLTPRELVTELAIVKAKAVQRMYPGALILAGDQVACIDGMILGKPKTEERARASPTWWSVGCGSPWPVSTGTARTPRPPRT